jgi:hypothetical protein
MAHGFTNAPVPVLHEHNGPIAGAVWSASLGEHLQRFHGQDRQPHWLGWHVHWVPASDWADREDAPFDSPHRSALPDDDVLISGPLSSATSAPVIVQHSRDVDLEVDSLPAESSRTRACIRPSPRHFFELHSSGLSVRALLGVARC